MAAQSLLEAREGGEDHPRVALVAAELALTTGQSDRAITILRAGLDRYPGDVPLMLRYGEILLQAGLADEVEPLLRKLQEAKLSRIRTGQIEAGILRARGDFRGAIDVFAWLVEKRPVRPDLREAYLKILTEAAESGSVEADEALEAARTAQEDFADDEQIVIAATRLRAVFDDEAAAQVAELEADAERKMAEAAARLIADPPRPNAKRKAPDDGFSLKRRRPEPETEQ
ncbi:hypothetical protein I5731_08255 [Methylobrevis sp. L22]|uniref:Tetratricopeptide repeat protein n=1 Tax=Methylobrevis albus TaxID=2793297 RepID=A0A931I0C5_9HYPH|nr:tetratricopeptide repeat protein [Methylobrevis albus]MBH0237810.1 hypothetical protein [Methylobrevis albus]